MPLSSSINFFVFALGVFFQLLLFFLGVRDFKRLGLVLLMSLFAAVVFYGGNPQGATFSAAFVLFLSMLFFVVFHNDLLPIIDERFLLFVTFLFWFVASGLVHFNFSLLSPWVLLAVPPTIGVFVLVFTKFELHFGWKYVFFFCFFAAVFYFGTVNLESSPLVFVLIGAQPQISGIHVFEAFFSGMALTGFLAAFDNLLSLLPAKRETLDRWKKRTQLDLEHFSNRQINYRESALIFLIFIVVSALTMYFDLSIVLIMNILFVSMIFFQNVDHLLHKPKKHASTT